MVTAIFVRLCIVAILTVLSPQVDATDNVCDFDLELTTHILNYRHMFKEVHDVTTTSEFFKLRLPEKVTDVNLRYDSNMFMKAELDDQRNLIFKPTEAFNDYEYLVQSAESRYDEEIELDIAFTCGEGWRDSMIINFVQPIKDLNNHVPTFNRKQYNYQFGMTLREGAILTNVLEIYAVDVDYTNSGVNFTVDSAEVEISFKKTDRSGKIHYATLKTLKELVQGEYTYTIEAEDTGTPKSVGKAEVKIVIT